MNRANITLAAGAAGCVIAGGILLAVTEHLPIGDGLSCSVGTATTAGCNTSAPAAAQVVSVLLMLTAIPLLGALFARLTAHHAGNRAAEAAKQHIDAAEKRIKAHITEHVKPRPEGM